MPTPREAADAKRAEARAAYFLGHATKALTDVGLTFVGAAPESHTVLLRAADGQEFVVAVSPHVPEAPPPAR